MLGLKFCLTEQLLVRSEIIKFSALIETCWRVDLEISRGLDQSIVNSIEHFDSILLANVSVFNLIVFKHLSLDISAQLNF